MDKAMMMWRSVILVGTSNRNRTPDDNIFGYKNDKTLAFFKISCFGYTGNGENALSFRRAAGAGRGHRVILIPGIPGK